MLKYDSLEYILKGYITEEDDIKPFYDVGERTVWVLDPIMKPHVQDEIIFIEELLYLGGYEGCLRISMDVYDLETDTLKEHQIEIHFIKIPHHVSCSGVEQTKQR